MIEWLIPHLIRSVLQYNTDDSLGIKCSAHFNFDPKQIKQLLHVFIYISLFDHHTSLTYITFDSFLYLTMLFPFLRSGNQTAHHDYWIIPKQEIYYSWRLWFQKWEKNNTNPNCFLIIASSLLASLVLIAVVPKSVGQFLSLSYEMDNALADYQADTSNLACFKDILGKNGTSEYEKSKLWYYIKKSIQNDFKILFVIQLLTPDNQK